MLGGADPLTAQRLDRRELADSRPELNRQREAFAV
jgi:hypothetical protein